MDGLDFRLEKLKAAFAEEFHALPTVNVRAPGRVNLIGEHTDYNEGFVFPCAIDRDMMISARPNDNNQVRARSLDYDSLDIFDLNDIKPNGEKGKEWSNYLRGMLKVMRDAGHKIVGFDAVLSGDVPQGAGLSSSAAFEVAVGILQRELAALDIENQQIALLAQKAENEFVGVQCGIMDQFISALGHHDCALMIDCRSLEYKSVPLNFDDHELSLVIVNSGVRRGLVDSEYNARREECKEGAALLGKYLERPVNALRDVTLLEFNKYARKLPDTVARRCRHVISENERVLKAVDVLRYDAHMIFGHLMNESHESLRDDFQVSCAELDLLVSLSQKHNGVLGARMTGAGFGGCVVALIKTSAIDSFRKKVVAKYEQELGLRAAVYECESVSGACVVNSALARTQ